jgi:hypothetical protein
MTPGRLASAGYQSPSLIFFPPTHLHRNDSEGTIFHIRHPILETDKCKRHCHIRLASYLLAAKGVNRRRAHLGTHPTCTAFNYRSLSPSNSPSTLLPSRHACFAHAPDLLGSRIGERGDDTILWAFAPSSEPAFCICSASS